MTEKRMCVSVALLGLFLLSVSVDSDTPVTAKVGDEVVLAPGSSSVTGPITTIVWKHGESLAMEWDGNEVEAFRHFKARGHLNLSMGTLTIKGLMLNDSGTYTADINSRVSSTTLLQVMHSVPKPNISKSCNAEMTSCVLTCDGDTTHVHGVTYSWRLGGMLQESRSKEYEITKESSSEKSEFHCELANPVSRERSHSITNLFATILIVDPPKWYTKVRTGIVVFVTLVVAVVTLISIHRLISGMWFHQQPSMPWEADFWRKQQEAGRKAADSKDAASGEPEEGEAMT